VENWQQSDYYTSNHTATASLQYFVKYKFKKNHFNRNKYLCKTYLLKQFSTNVFI